MDNLPSDPADASVVAGLIAALEAKVDIVDTNVDAILVDTGTDIPATLTSINAKTTNLPSDPADQSIIIAATDAILAAVADVPTNAELTTALSGFSTQASVDAVAVKVGDIWQLEGLDSANVLTVTTSARTVGSIVQAIAGDSETSVTVTRAP